MDPEIKEDSWLTSIAGYIGGLLILAPLFFYLGFHRLLGLPLKLLIRPFLVVAIIMAFFLIAAKLARERLISRGETLPLVIATVAFNIAFAGWIGLYAYSFGYFDRDFMLVWVIGVLVVSVPLYLGARAGVRRSMRMKR